MYLTGEAQERQGRSVNVRRVSEAGSRVVGEVVWNTIACVVRTQTQVVHVQFMHMIPVLPHKAVVELSQ